MPPSQKHNRKKKNVTRGAVASNTTSTTTSTTSSYVTNKNKEKESYEDLKASGVVTEILEKDLHSKTVLIQRGNVNGDLKRKCSATADLSKVVKDYHEGYCAIPESKRGEKTQYVENIIAYDLKDYTFVQHDPDSNKFYRYNLETKKGKSIVRSKIGQAFRDRTASLKKDQSNQNSPTVDTSRSDLDEASRTTHSFSSSLNVSFHGFSAETLIQSPTSVGSGKRKERDYDEIYYDSLSQLGNQDTSSIPDFPPPVTQIDALELNEIILNDTGATTNLSGTSNEEFGSACFDFSFLDSEDCDLTLEALNDDNSIDVTNINIEGDLLDGTQFRNMFDSSK